MHTSPPQLNIINIKEPEELEINKVTSIKKNALKEIYRKTLKRHPFTRQLVISTWKTLYPFYISNIHYILSFKTRRWQSLVKTSTYIKIANIKPLKILDSASIDTPTPQTIPPEDRKHLTSPHKNYVFPYIYSVPIENAEVYAGTNLVFTKDTVIHHDLYNFELDYTSEELHGRHIINPKRNLILLLKKDSKPEKIPTGASFLDACSSNYAHWITEVLPRISAFCSIKKYSNIPIIIDDKLHKNIMESLSLIVGNTRPIIKLPMGRSIVVKKLYLTSPSGYVPFEKRRKNKQQISHGLFSPIALNLLKESLLPLLEKSSSYPSKIYLRRNSEIRNIRNQKEVEEQLIQNGYTLIEPEKLTFLQQITLFNNVNEIIASSGAAIANLVFAPSNTTIHILIGKSSNTSYWYWQNMACSTNKQVTYILGKKHHNQSSIHSDFLIDVEKLP